MCKNPRINSGNGIARHTSAILILGVKVTYLGSNESFMLLEIHIIKFEFCLAVKTPYSLLHVNDIGSVRLQTGFKRRRVLRKMMIVNCDIDIGLKQRFVVALQCNKQLAQAFDVSLQFDSL